jgi:biuret amidohydrolase
LRLEVLPKGTGELDHRLDPARTAILGIHWQAGFADPDDPFGAVFGKVIAATGVLDTVERVFRASRDAGALVVHVNICNPPDIIVNTAIYHHAQLTGGLACGSPPVAEIPRLADPADLSVDHHRCSAFADTDLDAELRGREIDTVVVTGLATNVAVEGTARDAADRGFFVYVLPDCCVAGTEGAHDASVANMKVLTTKVLPSAEYLAALRTKG